MEKLVNLASQARLLHSVQVHNRAPSNEIGFVPSFSIRPDFSRRGAACYPQGSQTRPSMSFLSIRDLDLTGKRVFIRVDFNVPLSKNEQGQMEITSDKRIKASLPTIQYALDHGAGVILASHLDRPKGKRNPDMSLAPTAVRLQQLLGRSVKMAPDCPGPEVQAMIPALVEVLLPEN